MNGQNNKHLIKKIASFTGIASISAFLCLPAAALDNTSFNQSSPNSVSSSELLMAQDTTGGRGTTGAGSNQGQGTQPAGSDNRGTGGSTDMNNTGTDRQRNAPGTNNTQTNDSGNPMYMNNTTGGNQGNDVDPTNPAVDSEGNVPNPAKTDSNNRSNGMNMNNSGTSDYRGTTTNYSNDGSGAGTAVQGMW